MKFTGYENWNQELKNIYDTLPDLKIIFSGSSSLNLIKGKYDLSRRAVLYDLPGLSFREYLALEKKQTYPVLSLEEVLKNSFAISQNITQKNTILNNFNKYLKKDIILFINRINICIHHSRLLNTTDKAIYEDIASFL